MDFQLAIVIFIGLAVLVVSVPLALAAYVFRSIYKKNQAALDLHPGAIRIRPAWKMFVFWWLTLIMAAWIIALLLAAPLISSLAPGFLQPIVAGESAFLMVVFGFVAATIAYPYYTLLLDAGKLDGPTLWGFRWKRTEIAFSDMDMGKSFGEQWVHKLGLNVFHSTGGVKILALGLDETQVGQICAASAQDEHRMSTGSIQDQHK